MNFKERLEKACDTCVDIPPFGRGRQTIIAKKLEVSAEAVRKWFSGESTPRPKTMKALAKTLGEDYVWLALGTDYKKTESLKEIAKLSDTAMFAFCGLAMENGYSFALNEEVTIGADLVLIKQANIVYIKLLTVDVRNKNKVQLPKSPSIEKVKKVIASRNTNGDISYDFFEVPSKIVTDNLTFETNGNSAFIENLEIKHLTL